MKEQPYRYVVEGKEIDIIKEDWAFLFILDACRYDMFKEVYKEIFGMEETLKKAISPATWTMEWLNKIFGEKYHDDIIYISGNVFVNSKRKMCYKENGKRCFDAKRHFFKVVDVWNFGWSNNLNTVHPVEINKAFHKYYLKYPNKRFILHYVQPHQPFITIKKNEKDSFDKKKRKNSTPFRCVIRKYLPEEISWKIKKMLDFPVGSDVEKIYREKGWEGIKEIYKNEIRLVLNHVKMLTDSVTENFVITSDHGERLGEYLFNSRHGGRRDKEVIEVPWFEVRKRIS